MNFHSVPLPDVIGRLTQATAVQHIFHDDAGELGGGEVQYALQVADRLFLVWQDLDSHRNVVTPVERWDLRNLMDSIDEPLSVLSFHDMDSPTFEELAGQAIAAQAQPAKTTR